MKRGYFNLAKVEDSQLVRNKQYKTHQLRWTKGQLKQVSISDAVGKEKVKISNVWIFSNKYGSPNQLLWFFADEI